MALQVCAVFVSRHLSRPGAVGVPGRLRDVIHRRCPGVVVLRVVLGAERLKHKLGGLETGRDLEVGWNELGHASDRRSSAQAEPEKRTMTCPTVLTLEARLTGEPDLLALPEGDPVFAQ